MFLVLKRKNLVVLVALALVAVICATCLVTTGTAAVYFGQSTRKVPVYSVETSTDEKTVALTFDAAWGADKTLKILEVLREYEAEGTFFLVGFWIDKYPNETKAVAEAGCDIGNHSENHLNMSKLDKDAIESEIESVNKKVKDLTGITPTYFRAPYGDYDNELLSVVEAKNMVGVQWSIDTLDWKGISASQITERVLGKVQSGDIVLFHNNSDHVLDALPLVLSALKNKGFKCVKLSSLVATENYSVDARGVQRKNQ